MHVSSSLHVTQDVVLEFWHKLERIRHVLVLLNITNHLGGLRPLCEVDQISLLDDGRNTILNEGKISQINTYNMVRSLIKTDKYKDQRGIPKNGMHGGFAT